MRVVLDKAETTGRFVETVQPHYEALDLAAPVVLPASVSDQFVWSDKVVRFSLLREKLMNLLLCRIERSAQLSVFLHCNV